MILVYNRRTKQATLQEKHPDAAILDMTSQGSEPWVAFSPFYPHGGIPVPFSPGYTSASVEGIWQGLKVFESVDVDTRSFQNATMKKLKRTVRTLGKVLGHREGVKGERLLAYKEARFQIYLPSYKWVLDHRLQEQLKQLRALHAQQDLIFLDYETNGDLTDLRKPVSHAALIRFYLEDQWPD